MRKIQDLAAYFFILAVAVLSTISILGVWKVFGNDVIIKSFQTLGLLALVAIVVAIAGKFVDSGSATPEVPADTSSFTAIRHGTVTLLIVFIAMIALLGVLAIWDVISGDAVGKSVSSMAIASLSALIVAATCLQREDHPLMHKQVSGWGVFFILIGAWIVLTLYSF